jgi:Zn-dependent protease
MPTAERRKAAAARESGTGSWSLLLGRVFGIPIRVHFTFVLLLIWFGMAGSSAGGTFVMAVVFLLALFGCVVLHELGHALTARAFGVRTREIVLYPIGGIARLENMPRGWAELVIALAGPLVNLFLAGFLMAVIIALALPMPEALGVATDLGGFVWSLFIANMLLFAFNLIPAFPMDGGRILRAGLALRMADERATQIAATVGQGFAIFFALVGILQKEPVLILIAFFVFLGAGQEALFHRRRAVVLGRTAGEAMMTRFEVLAPQDSLERASELLLAADQQDFPVVDAWQRVAGVLPRAALLEGLARLGKEGAVLEVMRREVTVVPPDHDLEGVLRHLQANPTVPVLVLDEDRLMGMITLENLTEFIEVTRRVPRGDVEP